MGQVIPRRISCQSLQKLSQVLSSFTGQKLDLHPYLDTLQFRNGPSFVHANQRFGWEQFCVLYSEPENVSTIRFGWDSLGLRSYLFENPGNQKKQRSPPGGMRSAVPLGGLGKSFLETDRTLDEAVLNMTTCLLTTVEECVRT